MIWVILFEAAMMIFTLVIVLDIFLLLCPVIPGWPDLCKQVILEAGGIIHHKSFVANLFLWYKGEDFYRRAFLQKFPDPRIIV